MYRDNDVGEIVLPPGAPAWLIQLMGSVVNVDRAEFLSTMGAVTAQVGRGARDAAVARARRLAEEFGLKPADVFSGGGKRTSIAAKYRDPASGKTWTGRGKPPQWIAGLDRTQFLIA